MILGFVTAIGLEIAYGGLLPFGYGLTSGCFGLVINLIVYVACAYWLPHSAEERQRIEDLFAIVRARRVMQVGSGSQAQPALA
ncbi:hypothetical protein OKC48_27615 [Methylorubrum extorquens]|nr:hypothetical protein [Methylorubrum extorquens]UYW26946.1 hypothetical protein OKC48_27615 [Methylorubrum extorquens]